MWFSPGLYRWLPNGGKKNDNDNDDEHKHNGAAV